MGAVLDDMGMANDAADALTLYKRWSLRPDLTIDDVRRFVVQRILPAYEELSPDVELGVEADAEGRSIIAVQRWSSVLAHESAFTGASFERWWAAEIIRIADRDDRTVVSKDHDLLDGHLLNDAPQRLLLVTTGNIRNDDLIALIEAVEPLLVEAFEHSVLVEVNRGAVIGH